MNSTRIITIIAAIMLLWALADNPYGYYQILRWVVCGTSGYLAFQAHERGKKVWMWLLGITAVLFNPIAPIHLSREVWAVVDVAVAVLLFVSLFTFRKN